MMFILGQILKLVRILNSEKGATSIAVGLAMGMVLGLVPSNFLIIVGFFFLFCVVRINGAAFFLGWGVFKLLAYLLDPWFDQLGYWLLAEVPSLRATWIYLYNLPVVPWTRFNNSIILGSFVVGLALFIPAILIFRWLIGRYRDSVLKRLTSSKWFKAFKATSIYKLYNRYAGIREQF